MKTLHNILLIFVAFTFLISCEDSLDVIQPGELSEDEAFNSIDDLTQGLNAIYFGLNTAEAIQISSFFTDETNIGFDNGGQNIRLLQFQLNTTSPIPSRLWNKNYSTINRVNRLLAQTKKIKIEEKDKFRLDEIIGQLLIIRAAENFELLTFFSSNLQDDNALGVMKLDFVPSIETELARVTNREMFEFIESDINQAKRLIDNTNNSPFIISENFITALEARMYLYRGKNILARTKADKIISKIKLSNRNNYINLFKDIGTDEAIFIGKRTQNEEDNGIPRNFYFREVRKKGGAFMEISRGLFNQLNKNDIRYDVIVLSESNPDKDYRSNGGKLDTLLIGKYPGKPFNPLQNDYKYFRVSEMYLIKAEAEAQLGNLTEVTKILKILRDARFNQPTVLDNYSSKEEALSAVLKERRIELAFEGHRYIDLKRLNPAGIDRDLVECSILNACQLSPDEFFKYTFPIPQSELSGNTLIREQQNPGYVKN